MSIVPLPQFEADLEQAEREAYERLKPPSTIVVRFGVMGLIGEFPYDGKAKPGCGSKIVVRTARGVELGEMLTSTCPNSGCSKSVSRQEMLQYIENSGGKDYPFFTEGRVLRIATVEDMNAQARLDATKTPLVKQARAHVAALGLDMKIVEAEPILGGERLTFYFTSENRVDFRELVRLLAADHHTRIELRQIGARDEARLTADYERCGQHCCCRQFLKVLKPVSMRSAKTQKATLDPLKISGRCGRLMCCLRYEDETYETLRKRLPKRNVRVGTPEGDGFVVDTQILTQLVLVALENEQRNIAVPVEDLTEPGVRKQVEDPLRGAQPAAVSKRTDDRRQRTDRPTRHEQQDRYRKQSQEREGAPGTPGTPGSPATPGEGAPSAEGSGESRSGKRRRRRRKPGDRPPQGQQDGARPNDQQPRADRSDSGGDSDSGPAEGEGGQEQRKRRRRRRRRGRGRGGDSGPGGDSGGSGDSGGGGGGSSGE